MSDLGSSNYSEVDASNTAAVPNGWPEGMQPSGANNSARADMGAAKRFWNRINAIKTTGGTTSAYTLAYDQAAAQYYDGEIHSFVVNATSAAAATLNISGLGARQLRLFGGNLLAGALLANQVVQVRYNLSATAFDIIPQNGWVRLGEQDPSGASTVDFTSIPSGVNNLHCVFDLDPSVNGAGIRLRTYGPSAAIDSGASDYYYAGNQSDTASVNAAYGDMAEAYIPLNGGNVYNGTSGFSGEFTAPNIQATTYTKFLIRSTYLNNDQTAYVNNTIGGGRIEAARITGIRIYPSSGTVTGKVTLLASA